MFTGIITDVGALVARSGGVLTMRSMYPAETITIGASIACDGCCLTVTTRQSAGNGSIVTADVSNETLSKTTLGTWQPGQRVNLERALKAGDELGGHIVSGHIDAVARIVDIRADGASRRFVIESPPAFARYIASKGSVALDGTSLTVNDVDGNQFGVNLIPHTLTQTTWGSKQPGDTVNLEVDLFARYIERMMGAQTVEQGQ